MLHIEARSLTNKPLKIDFMNRKKLQYPLREEDYVHMSASEIRTFLKEQQSLYAYFFGLQFPPAVLICLISLIVYTSVFPHGFTMVKEGIFDYHAVYSSSYHASVFVAFICFPLLCLMICVRPVMIYHRVAKSPYYRANINQLQVAAEQKEKEDEAFQKRLEEAIKEVTEKMKEVCISHSITWRQLYNRMEKDINPSFEWPPKDN